MLLFSLRYLHVTSLDSASSKALLPLQSSDNLVFLRFVEERSQLSLEGPATWKVPRESGGKGVATKQLGSWREVGSGKRGNELLITIKVIRPKGTLESNPMCWLPGPYNRESFVVTGGSTGLQVSVSRGPNWVCSWHVIGSHHSILLYIIVLLYY